MLKRIFGRISPFGQDFSAIGIIALLTILFFFPLWGRGVWLPHGGGDAVSFLYPMYRFIATTLHAGEIPLWNPHQYAGYPLIADNQAGIFYPFNLILFLLNPDFGYGWLEFLVGWHIFWAGLGMYVCIRWWRKAQFPAYVALFAAIAFMFSDVFITHLGNLNLIAVASWLPWVLFAYHRALTRPRWIVICGVIIGISTLAGHGQMTFFIALMVGLYALWSAVSRRQGQPLLLLLVAGAIGVGLAAVSLVPALDLNPLTRRGAFTYAESVNYSLPWRALVGMFAPNFYGRGPALFWGDWLRVEVGYVGVGTLLLAMFAWKGKGERDEGKEVWFFVGVGVLGLLLALGENAFVHRPIFEPLALPFQVPARFVLLTDFCLAFLAGIGLHQLAKTEASSRRLWLWLIAIVGLVVWLSLQLDSVPAERLGRSQRAIVVLTVFGLGGWLLVWLRGYLGRRVFVVGMIGLVSAEIFITSQYIEIEWNNPLTGYQNETAISYLQANAGLYRIDEATALWQPSAAQLFNLYSAGGVFNPLELATHATYMGSVGYRGSPVYSLLGIKYIIAGKDEPPGDTNFIPLAFAEDASVNVYENMNVLPRIQMLYQSQIVANGGEAFAALHSGLDFTETIIVENGTELVGAGEYSIDVVAYENNRILLDVTTTERGYLLLTDMYYPHWQAFIDGEPTPIEPANFAFRGVLVPVGSHQVEMFFKPDSWRLGWQISLATIGLLICWVAFIRLRKS